MGCTTTRPPTTARRCAPLLLAGLLMSVGCAAPPGASVAPPGARDDHVHRPVGHTVLPHTVMSTQATEADSAVQLRSTLERLLGAHVLLADEYARAILKNQDDQSAAARGEVDRNQQELVEAVASWGGAQAGTAFGGAWRNHVDLLGSYSTALRTKDIAGQRSARASYGDAEGRLAEAFSTVVGGTVSKQALLAAAVAHGEHLLDQADAFAAGDHDRAYAVQREAFTHMIAAADVLARGAARAKGVPTSELDTPRRRLQTVLSGLLAEHMALMVQSMRAAHDRGPDFSSASGALNANTTDLGGAVNTLYGAAASRDFLALWAQHAEGLIQYAAAPDDRATQERARAAQVDYAPKLARFLAGATDQRLPAIELAAGLTLHDDQLLAQADAYHGADHRQAQRVSQEGYAHMFDLSQQLAAAIGDTVASRLPQGGAATGDGGLAGPG